MKLYPPNRKLKALIRVSTLALLVVQCVCFVITLLSQHGNVVSATANLVISSSSFAIAWLCTTMDCWSRE